MSLPPIAGRRFASAPSSFGAEAPAPVRAPREPSPVEATSPAPTTAAKPEASAFARLLRGLAHEIDAGEHATRDALRSAASGRDLSPTELIALQNRIYRYSEAVDLAARLVDRAANGARTVLQGQ